MINSLETSLKSRLSSATGSQTLIKNLKVLLLLHKGLETNLGKAVVRKKISFCRLLSTKQTTTSSQDFHTMKTIHLTYWATHCQKILNMIPTHFRQRWQIKSKACRRTLHQNQKKAWKKTSKFLLVLKLQPISEKKVKCKVYRYFLRTLPPRAYI